MDLNNFGNKLSECIDKNLPVEAERFISLTNKQLTDIEVSSVTRDSYILNIFNKSNGILWFLNQVLHKSEYKQAKLSSFDLLYTVINNNVKQVQNYLTDSIQTVSLVIRSSASAIEKQKSLKLITLIVLKGKFIIPYESTDCAITNLYKTLYQCLHCRFDKSNIVQEELIKAIGAIAKKFPSVIYNNKDLQNLIIVQLRHETQKSNKSYPVLGGYIEALSDVLCNFAFEISVDVTYEILKNLINPGDAHRRGAFRASMTFARKHVTLMSKHIYRDAEWWHQSTLNWFDLGLEDKKTANAFLHDFYMEMANILSRQTEDYDKKLFKYFISYLESVIAKRNEDSYVKQLAIYALGQFSKAFKMHLSTKEIDRIFGVISFLIEDTYILNLEKNSSQIIHLPHYIEALSSIIKNQTQLNKSNILLLERISVVLIKIFPKLSPGQHYLVIESFTIMLTQLKGSSSTLENFLEDVLYQGVMWTCSHNIAVEEELNNSSQETCTYKNYMAFWKGIFNNNINSYEKYDISGDVIHDVVEIFFSQLIITHFNLIAKLNLNIKCKDNISSMTSIDVSYEAIQANDFIIFYNIVDFYQTIFEEINCELFRPWIINYINEMLSKSIKFPFVSGFYKLLTCSLKCCDSLNIFESINSSRNDVTICHESLCNFIQETLKKIKLFRGDLQISCLKLMLASPISIVKIILPSTVPAFISLFDIGRSYLSLTSLGIDTLNKWFKCIPVDDYEPFLRQILPMLDSYLQTKLVSEHSESVAAFKSRKTKKAVDKRKILVETESELFRVQIQLLTFIGQLNSELCSVFVNSINSCQPSILNRRGNLKMSLPFEGAKVELYLDQMVPRIVELAINSSNRKIRITACEVLHAMVMILLGTSHPLDNVGLKELEGLVKIIIEAVLTLGCDTDQVVQQLFCPLALQLMHYYSHPRQIGNDHTQVVIKLLIEGVSNTTNSSLRDFSGKCIKEYVSWSIKQISKNDLLKNSINIKVWIRVINSFCVHPDLFKRLGAALIFNNIYFVLREEQDMFDMYWLEILNSFVTNLSLMDVCDNDSMCIEQVYRSLEHLKRGFVEKHEIFNKSSNIRRTPYGFGGNLLKDVAIWLLKQTGCLNSYCRLKCISLLDTIVPLVKDCKNLQTFVQTYLANDANWISSTYVQELTSNSILNNEDVTFNSFFKWLEGLLCALDGSMFIITNNLTSNVVFTKSTFFVSLQFYLEKIHYQDLSVQNLKSKENITIVEEEKFNKLTSLISDKIIELLSTILNKQVNVASIFDTNEFWNKNTWKFINQTIFESNLDNFEKRNQVLNLLNSTYNLPESALNELTNEFSSSIINKQLVNLDLQSSTVSVDQYRFLRGMLIIQESIFNKKLNVSKYVAGTVNYLCSNLISTSNETEAILKLNKKIINFYSLKLDIALENEQELMEMLKFIGNESVDNLESDEDIKYGLSFFETFKETLLKHLLKNYKLFISQAFQLETIDGLFKYMFEFLKYAQKRKNRSFNKKILSIALENMEKRLTYFNGNVTQMLLGLDFLNQLTSLSTEPLYNFLPQKSPVLLWTVDLLHYDDPNWSIERGFNFKSEVLSVIPWIIGPGTEYSLQLRAAFTSLKTKYFHKTNTCTIAMKTTFIKFLHAMKVSRSNEMLLRFVDIFLIIHEIIEPEHLEYLLKQFIIKSEDQTQAICLLYKMSFESGDLKYQERYIIAKIVLPTLLQYCLYDAFENFYVAKIKTLQLVLSQKDDASSNFNICHIVNRTIALIMIELLFSRIKLENLEDNSCPISKACFPEELPSKRTIIKSLTSSILDIFKENYNLSNKEGKSIFRLYQCHNYNALVSIVSTSQKNEKFYTLLFKREENKQDVLWTKIIDLDKKYVFEMDFDEVPQMRKKILNIRNNLKSKPDETNAAKIKYIESQHLFNSTLSEDITQFDFTGATLRTSYEYEQNQNKNEESKKMEIGLEAIPINEHECMGTICGLIQYIFDNDVCTLPTSQENVVLPAWMKEIRNTLISDNTHVNIKVYLIKIIHNTQHIFKYYAKWFLAPIISAVITNCFGSTLNFVVADLVTMLTLWSEFTVVHNDVKLKSDLLKFCMQNTDNPNRAIFKYNLELSKIILETWNVHLTIPCDTIFEKLSSDLQSLKLEVGIHLAAVVLANNIAPWDSNSIPKFLKTLVRILISDSRNVYQPCTEVIGLSLRFMNNDPNLQIHLSKFTEFVDKSLEKLTDDNKFAYCLQGIAVYYPTIVDKYLCKMVSKLNHLMGNFKIIYLKIFGMRVDRLDSINELFSINFEKLLNDNDTEVQLLTLELIQKATKHFKGKKLALILEHVFKLVNSSYAICRTVVYDIFIAVYYMHFDKISIESKEIIKTCTNALLLGLVDKDLELQEKIISFWSNTVDLPRDVSKRILYLLQRMYNSDVEEHYIGYSTYLLLNLIASTQEFNEKLFQFTLHDCKFQEYRLNSNWRMQHISTAPLFVESIRSQETNFSLMDFDVLRATISSYEFEPTQAENVASTSKVQATQISSHTSSLLFTIDDSSAGNEVFKDPNKVLPKVWGFRGRRFLKDRSKVSRHYAYLETKKALKAEEVRKEKVKQNERKVTIYRKYRIGDYPDIEVTLSAVLTPLQLLAKFDANLSRGLYTNIFTSVFDKLHKSAQIDNTYVQDVNLSINNIFNNSTDYIPSMIATFLDIALKFSNILTFDPDTISNVCEWSGLYSIGSLILEEYLISKPVEETPAKKRKGAVQSQQSQYWIKYARLYKDMEEWDVVTSIFMDKLNCSEVALKAVEAECSAQWRVAQESYCEALHEDVCQDQKDFYYESYFKCFAALGEWNVLSSNVEQMTNARNQTDVWSSLWNDNWNQQKLLPWYIKAELRNLLSGSPTELFTSINASLSNEEKLEHLKLNYGEEIAMLWLLQGDNEVAKFYLNFATKQFLNNWLHLNPLLVKLRINKVTNLQTLIDVYSFINEFDKINSENYKTFLPVLLKCWEPKFQNTVESLFLNETRTIYRNQFVTTLTTKLRGVLSANEIQEVTNGFTDLRFKMYLNLVECALKQGNYFLARKYIKLSPKPEKDNVYQNMQRSLTLSKTVFLKSQTCNDNDTKLNELITSLKLAPAGDFTVQDDTLCYLLKTSEHVCDISEDIRKIVTVNNELFLKHKTAIQKCMRNSLLNGPEDIRKFSIGGLQETLDGCENAIQTMMNSDNLKVYECMANANVKLAYYVQNDSEMENVFIMSVLRAMKLGSVEGRQLFPCLLNLNIGTTFKEIFTKEVTEIPIWMFLGWIPQMLANIGASCIFVIKDILIEIAKTYPQAIIYAYRLSKEKFDFTANSIGDAGRDVTKQLDDMLQLNNLDDFLKAMRCVTVPTVMLCEHVKKLIRSCTSKHEFDTVLKQVIEEVYFETPDYKNVNSFHGSLYKSIEKYKNELKKISAINFVPDTYRKALNKLLSELKTSKDKSSKLVEYSPWLANYQVRESQFNLEIPGQYTGESRPLVQHHIKIVGFSSTVTVLQSLRKPIKITIIGNNAKEYDYLVKYGEDLRQDQRIQQLLMLMNKTLSNDLQCHKRQLSLQTYQVIPLTDQLGIIEWISHAKELKKYIEDGCELYQRQSITEAESEYIKWITKAGSGKSGDNSTMYGQACLHYDRKSTICKYRTLVNSVPMNILKKAFWNISANSESFFAFRNKFAVSYAITCLAHWLLGIGDRHLSNILISVHNGETIGIDFGHAFGSATQILQIPELVPFRLTPHILSILEPLNELGLIQETMIHSLKAFRSSSKILLATMRVFINEPSLDWLEFAKHSEIINQVTNVGNEWYPVQKLKHVELKLKGENSVNIMVEELKAGHSHRPNFLKGYIDVVKGDPEHNYRARKQGNLSEEEQVKCLLDHATDDNLLGRMYVGWSAWI